MALRILNHSLWCVNTTIPKFVICQSETLFTVMISCDIKLPTWYSPIFEYSKYSRIHFLVRFGAMTGLFDLTRSIWAQLLLAKTQTMAQPNLPAMPPKHIKKAELGITTVNNKQQLVQWDVMETKKWWQIDFKNKWREKNINQNKGKKTDK